MSDFDPYHQWLGIPPQEQPAHHYRLLGITDFEVDRGVISAAAEQRTIYLRTLQAGEHAVLVAKLLNEVSQARVTLLNADQKTAYDEELRKQQAPEPEAEPTPPPIPVVQTPIPPPTPVVVGGTVTQEFPVSVVQSAKKPRRRKPKEIWKRPAVIGISLVGVIGVLALLMFSGDADPVASNTPPVVTSEPELTPRPETPPIIPRQRTQPTASNETSPAKEAVAPPLAAFPFDANTAQQHQQQWAHHRKIPIELTNSIGMALRFIPPGEFNMGSEQGGPDEKPVHRVTLTQGYYLGVLEVTQEQYQTIMQQIPRSWSNRKADPADGRRYPIDNVEWHVAMDFCRRLSESPEEARHQRKYRLPTEAEWEFACRAGTNTRWVFGDDPSQLPEHEWHSVHGRTVHFVGTKTANPWGIYDMPGNVWEWCVDFYGSYSQNPVTNPRGPESSAHRVVRGGCWWVGWNDCRNTKRHSSSMAHHRRRLIGFRVVLDVPDN